MITDIEKEFNTEIQELKKLRIEEDEVKDKINELKAEHRSKLYVKEYLRSWIDRIKEQQVIQEIAGRNHPVDYFINELSKTIKYDKVTALCNTATAVSAYTKEPLNSYLRGQSSIGKTYTVIETTKYFPEEDVWNLGGMSPTALIHERGLWIDSEGREIRPEDEPEKPRRKDYDTREEYERAKAEYEAELAEWNERLKNSYKLVDISHKILLFLEAPHPDTINKIKMILSHDKEQVMFKITDKNLKGQLETVTTIIKGFPAVFICSVRKENEETISRFFTYTPEMSENKYKAAMELINKRFSEKWNFNKETVGQSNLKTYIKAIRKKLVEEDADIIIPFNTVDLFSAPKNVDMRFYRYFLEMAQAFTVLNLFKRIQVEIEEKKYYLATIEDIVLAYILYQKIKETTETGEEQSVLEFYHKYLEVPDTKYTLDDLYKLWTATNKGRELSKETFRQKVVDVLVDRLGYLEKYPNPDNKRYNLYKPIKFSVKEGEEELTLHSLISNLRLSLGRKLEKSVREWVSKNLEKISYVNNKKISPKEGSRNEIVEWFTKKLLFINPKILRLCNIEGDVSNEEKKRGHSLISKIRESQVVNSEDSEEEIELELVPDEPDEAESNSTRKRQSCEVCGKVTNLVPVVRNNKTIMVCRVCREKVKREQFNERYHKPWNIGGVNLI